MVARAAKCQSKWVRGWIEVIARIRAVEGNVALFAHGHVLRVFVARWIALSWGAGQHFLLDTGTLCVLSHYYELPAVRVWNGPLPITG